MKLHRIRALAARTLLFVIAAAFALLFLAPTILTITNSFMTSTEISANYGQIFQNATAKAGSKRYIAERVNLKFIPDRVSFSQYSAVLIRSPEYLFKFWNSVILVVPIVVFQVLVASFAAYGFARYRGRLREIIFFSYIILMLMPYQVTQVPNYLVSDWLGILNTRWAIILTGIFSPLAVFILTKFMRRIPITYVEAASWTAPANGRSSRRSICRWPAACCIRWRSWFSSTTGTWSSSPSSCWPTAICIRCPSSCPKSTPARSAWPSP